MKQRILRATGIILTGALLMVEPVSNIYGAPVAGVAAATSQEADVNANEDGIKDFFNSVFKPIHDKLFEKYDKAVKQKSFPGWLRPLGQKRQKVME